MFGYRDYHAARRREELREQGEIEALLGRAMDDRDCLTEAEALRLALHLLGETAIAGTAPYRGIRRAYFHGAGQRIKKENENDL